MITISEKKIIERILVPIDFSNYSLNACFFAIHLSARLGAEVRLFHAFFNPMVDAMTFPDTYTYQSNMAEIFQELDQNARKEMARFSQILNRYARKRNLENVKINTELVAGQPGEEIDNVIKSFVPDIIVIGTRGHGEQANEVLGSVAARVIDNAGTPVLLVTQDARLKEEEVINVLYATNFDDSDLTSIKSLVSVLSSYNIVIKCVHFNTGKGRIDNIEKMEEMKRRLSEQPENIQVECHIIESDDILKDLNNFIEKNNIDLISLTHRKRNLFYRLFNPSLAKKLLFQTKRPVFVFN